MFSLPVAGLASAQALFAGYLREAGAAVLLELLDGATTGTLDAMQSSAAAFAEWLFLPAEVRTPGGLRCAVLTLACHCLLADCGRRGAVACREAR